MSAASQASVPTPWRSPIPEEQRERVFERFARLDDARDREHGGTGLGLSIVRQIAEEHGGHVEIEDRPGGGTTMRLTIPVRAE